MGAPTIDEIRTLVAQSGYSASSKSKLEEYLQAQAQGKAPYFFDANRTLLKVYQFFPQHIDEQNIALILLLSLLENDLLSVSCLIPERIQSQEPCSTVLQCAELLDSCQFTEFWETFGGIQGSDTLVKLVANSTARIQTKIIDMLALSYRTAPSSVVVSALKVKAAQDITALKHPSVESADGDTVTFAATADNTKRNRVFQEGVSFSAISTLMAKVARE